MMRRLNQISGLLGSRRASIGLLILGAMICTTLRGSATQSTAQPAGVPPSLASGQPTEVRLRRLHLVRPDLIPYPIVYEIFC
jgi:hypothetical protein